MKQILFTLLAILAPVYIFGQVGVFKLTAKSYPPTANLRQAVLDEFGSNYRIADFNDLKQYFNKNSFTIDQWYENLNSRFLCCFYWVEYYGNRDKNYRIYRLPPDVQGITIIDRIGDLILHAEKYGEWPILCKQIVERPIITVEVLDDMGNPVSFAKVSFCSSMECQNETTNAKGLVFFSAYETPTFMYAYKNKKGLVSARINQSSAKYTLNLPAAPITNYQAGDQINDFLDVASTAYGYVDDGLFIQSALEAITKGVSGVALPSLGVPGVFSINPIPVIGADGKLGLKISGKLFDEILKLWKITNPMYKDRVYYEYLPSY